MTIKYIVEMNEDLLTGRGLFYIAGIADSWEDAIKYLSIVDSSINFIDYKHQPEDTELIKKQVSINSEFVVTYRFYRIKTHRITLVQTIDKNSLEILDKKLKEQIKLKNEIKKLTDQQQSIEL